VIIDLNRKGKHDSLLFSIKRSHVFSNPAVPKDFMISDANSNRSGSAVFQRHPNLQEHNRFVCLF
jgi:hypothetical protein